MPATFYRDEAVFAKLKEDVFNRSWQWIGDKNLIPARGEVYPIMLLPDYLNEPMLLSRDNAGKHTLFKQCLHA